MKDTNLTNRADVQLVGRTQLSTSGRKGGDYD